MGTPEFAVPALEAIHASPHHDLVAVYTQPDKPVGRGLAPKAPFVKRKALELGLPVHQPEKLTPPGELEKLRALAPDVIVVVAYGKILRRGYLDLPRLGCVNLHSSLLPRWRGAAPIQWAILEGDRESGVSTMRLVEELDAGDILLQGRTALSPDETAGTLHDRLARMGAELILPTLRGLESGSLRGQPQDPRLATFAGKLSKEMEWLDPAIEARVLERRVRALNPWPGTSVWAKLSAHGPAQRLRIRSVAPFPDIGDSGEWRGRIFDKAGMLLFGTSRGALRLLSLQWEGRSEVDAAGFLNGIRGRRLELPIETVPPPDLPPEAPSG